jgi:hypothetical protein
MEWKGGNKLLRESPAKGKQILLFTVVERVAATAQYEGYAHATFHPAHVLDVVAHHVSAMCVLSSEVALLGVDLVDEPDREGGVRYNRPPRNRHCHPRSLVYHHRTCTRICL